MPVQPTGFTSLGTGQCNETFASSLTYEILFDSVI